MAAKWRNRGEPSSSGPPVTRGKRNDHPSPAVGSPAADLFRGLGGKRTDTRSSPAWQPGIETEIQVENGVSASQVNEFLATNQRAFAARFSSPPLPSPPTTNSNALNNDSSLMPPPHLPTPAQVAAQQQAPPPQTMNPPLNHYGDSYENVQNHQLDFDRFYAQPQQTMSVDGNSVSQAHARLAAAQELQNIRQQQAAAQSGVARNSNPTGTLTLTGHLGGLGTAGQLGANAVTTGSSTTSKRRSGTKKSASSSKGGGGRWTKEEDSKLRSAVQAVGASNWKMIATDYLGDLRTDVQCLHRWQKVLQPGLVKGPWTKEEDQIIIDCIEAGITKWSEIAERIPGRIGKQCRERWFNHLDPSLKKGGWTEEEDAILVEAQAKWGNSWTKIAKLLPGRSENAVKNRWNSATRRRQKDQQRTADKITADAIAIVNAADAAEKAAEQERAANGNGSVASRGHADDEDTECVPRSAIALLRAKREEARRAMELGLPPPDNCIGLGLHPSGPIIHPVKSNPAMDLDSLPKGKVDDYTEDKSEVEDEYDDEDEDIGVDDTDGGDPSLLEEAIEELDVIENNLSSLPPAPSAGLRNFNSGGGDGGGGSSGGDPNMDHLFQDSSLTEREKELIYRAYLAGIAQSGATPPSSGSPSNKSGGANNNLKIKFKKEKNSKSKAAGGSPVQWDFHTDGHANGPQSGHSSIPDGFLHEYGIEFPDDVEHLSGERRVVELDDDLELSSSLLTMSLDKDIPIDEMALSAGERLMLTKPMAEDAMAALGHGALPLTSSSSSSSSSSHGTNSERRRVFGKRSGGSSRKSKQSQQEQQHSPLNPLPDLIVSENNGKNGNRNNHKSKSSPSTGHRTRQSTSLNQSSLDSLLLPGGLDSISSMSLGLGSGNKGSTTSSSSNHHHLNTNSLIGEQQKAEVRREILFAQNMNGDNSSQYQQNENKNNVLSPNVYGLDLFDPSSSTELANSGDLVDLVNSPNLWMSNSLTFSSSLSPSNSNSQNSATKETSSVGLPVG